MPTGVSITLQGIIGLAQSVGGFLFILGGILAGLTLMVSGIAYLFAGSDTSKIQSAKGIFKAGLIGALIIFGMGTIISVVSGFATNPLNFFSSGGGGTAGTCQGGIRVGQPCTNNNDCPNEVAGTCGGAGQPLCSYSWCS